MFIFIVFSQSTFSRPDTLPCVFGNRSWFGGGRGLVLTVKTCGFRTIWNSSPMPRMPRKWWHQVLLRASLPHAPVVRMTWVLPNSLKWQLSYGSLFWGEGRNAFFHVFGHWTLRWLLEGLGRSWEGLWEVLGVSLGPLGVSLGDFFGFLGCLLGDILASWETFWTFGVSFVDMLVSWGVFWETCLRCLSQNEEKRTKHTTISRARITQKERTKICKNHT